jgi:histidinol dehydrogenase
MRILDVDAARKSILRRFAWDEMEVPDSILDRNEQIFGERITPDEAVRRILADVRRRGDEAVAEWTLKIDRVQAPLTVSSDDVAAAYEQVAPEVVDALRLAAQRIEAFNRRQPALSWIHNDEDGTVGQLVRAIERVGIYIPGGTAPLPSSLLMTAVPARVAGVDHLAVISPPQRDTGLPHATTLVAADIAQVDAIFVAGGAQAIGALAFGTESIPAVDKICGPGNLYTTLAKRQLFGMVGIDGLPGPTETLVIADESADPELAAADLLAQAEHDVVASAILLTPSRSLAERVQVAVMAQLETLERAETAAVAVTRNSGIVVTESLAQAFDPPTAMRRNICACWLKTPGTI